MVRHILIILGFVTVASAGTVAVVALNNTDTPQSDTVGVVCIVPLPFGTSNIIAVIESRIVFQTVELINTVTSQKVRSYILVRDGVSYTWTDGLNQGQKNVLSQAQQDSFFVNLETNKLDDLCTEKEIDLSVFTIPEYVNFLEIPSEISLESAKGFDNNLKMNLELIIKSNAEKVYKERGNYNRVCGVFGEIQDSNIMNAITNMKNIVGQDNVVCNSTGNPAHAWAISTILKSEPQRYLCLDSTGRSLELERRVTTSYCD